MFKRTKKTLAVLLATTFVLCLLLPMTALAGSSTYTATKTGIAKPGGTFDARVMVEVPQGAMTNPAAGDEGKFRVRLPKDTTVASVTADVPATYDNGVVNQFAANPTITQIKPDEFEFNVAKNAGAAGKGLMYIDFTQIKVPSGHSGDFKVVFEAQSSSVFSNGEVTVATVGTGTANVTIDDVKSFSSGGGAIDTIRIKEDRPGALKVAGDSIKLKLPQGFKWDTANANCAKIWGDVTIGAPEFDATADDGRSLKINVSGESTTASYLSIAGLKVNVDESVAKIGDVSVDVSGDSSAAPSSLTVGQYGDFSVSVEAFGDTPTKLSGRAAAEIGKFVIEESLPGSLIKDRTITLTLPENTRWKPVTYDTPADGINDAPRIDVSNTDQNGAAIGGWVAVDSDFRTIKATVNAASTNDPAKFVFEKGEISIAPNFKGDVELEVGGTAGVEGKVVIAKVVPVVTATAETVPQVKIGFDAQPAADLIITEGAKEALMSKDKHKELKIYLPAGVDFAKVPKFEVIEGDVVLESASATTGNDAADGNTKFALIKTRATSTSPAKIKVSDIQLKLDRTVMEGDIIAKIKGNLTATSEYEGTNNHLKNFSASTVASAVIAKTVTPAPTEVKANAT
ncbi:MAG: hypothetical protein PHC60_09515, partial [Heliobacteriaceae bacterium]|nr:hypothetical protein [Heliobacteriaceae bacterium]